MYFLPRKHLNKSIYTCLLNPIALATEFKERENKATDEKGIFDLYQKAINKMENIGKQYSNTDIQGKRLLLGSIFPNKIHFENKKVRTADINPILNEIASINKAYGGIKKWDKTKKMDLSHRVTAKGFEPPTLRAEI
jgi:site-specific DNA recombinase